jgi:two-component system OmpR family response regulator
VELEDRRALPGVIVCLNVAVPDIPVSKSQRILGVVSAFSNRSQHTENGGHGYMTRVLVVDHEIHTGTDLQYRLQEEGFWVDVEHEGTRGIAEALSGNYSIVVLEIKTPPLDGLDVLRRIRNRSTLPTLVFTSRGEEVDRIAGLDLGADDYVVKPCSPREVAARIRAILRRTRAFSASGNRLDVLTAKGLTLWPAQQRAEWRGEPLDLTSAEFSLLELLLRESGRPVSKEDLAGYVLGRLSIRYGRSIDLHLNRVRRKLGVLADGRPVIQAVNLIGYRLLTE